METSESTRTGPVVPTACCYCRRPAEEGAPGVERAPALWDPLGPAELAHANCDVIFRAVARASSPLHRFVPLGALPFGEDPDFDSAPLGGALVAILPTSWATPLRAQVTRRAHEADRVFVRCELAPGLWRADECPLVPAHHVMPGCLVAHCTNGAAGDWRVGLVASLRTRRRLVADESPEAPCLWLPADHCRGVSRILGRASGGRDILDLYVRGPAGLALALTSLPRRGVGDLPTGALVAVREAHSDGEAFVVAEVSRRAAPGSRTLCEPPVLVERVRGGSAPFHLRADARVPLAPEGSPAWVSGPLAPDARSLCLADWTDPACDALLAAGGAALLAAGGVAEGLPGWRSDVRVVRLGDLPDGAAVLLPDDEADGLRFWEAARVLDRRSEPRPPAREGLGLEEVRRLAEEATGGPCARCSGKAAVPNPAYEPWLDRLGAHMAGWRAAHAGASEEEADGEETSFCRADPSPGEAIPCNACDGTGERSVAGLARLGRQLPRALVGLCDHLAATGRAR